MSLSIHSEAQRTTSLPRFWLRLVISIASGLLIGAAVAALSPGLFWTGWLAASLIAIFAVYCLLAAWAWAGGGRLLAWAVALAFLLRLVTGMGLSLALPVWGYPEPTQQAGYLFKDAHARDGQAWDLAHSGQPLWSSFREEFVSDQYGGLLALSAGAYRLISPDAHRPFLILLLGAFVAALGLPFLYRASALRWGPRVALIAAWIYALYPDGIFFASSQMREPFLVGLACIAFWKVITWTWRQPASYLVLFGALLGMALISSRVAAAMAGFLGLLFLLEHVVGRSDRRWQMVGWAGLAAGVVLVLIFSLDWFRASAAWDMKVTDDESGRVAYAIDEASSIIGVPREWLRPPVLTIYGLTRPVLPATLVSDAKSQLMKGISIVRAFGWYLLAPFLIFALFTVWREPDPAKRRRMIWLALAVFVWLFIASARGGGDLVDNPRYRSLFLPWMALLAAWAIHWALVHKDAWLWRWLMVEGIFLAFLSQWYIKRYYKIGPKLIFWQMILMIVVLSALVLVGGWLWDRYRRSKDQSLAELQ